MTVIVWDGTTLATDKAASDGVIQWKSEKAWYHGDGDNRIIVSGAGPLHSIMAMKKWFIGGFDGNTFPSIQITDPCHFIVVSPVMGLYRYEGGPAPIDHGHDACAFGEGREFAYGALAMGATAAVAAGIACEYSVHCGLGVQEYRL